ncbi:MAG: YjfB family protein [Bacillota bacterium]
MEINRGMEQNLYSIQQALGMAVMEKAMMQDGESVAALIQGMDATNRKTMEHSVTPYKGSSIDIQV